MLNKPEHHEVVFAVFSWILRAAAAILIMFAGFVIMKKLQSLRIAPPRKETSELVRTLSVLPVIPETVQLEITGYGTARPARVVSLAAEVKGRIIFAHATFQAGVVVGEGELLLKIDPSEYQLALNGATAEIDRIQADIAALRQQLADDRRRLEILHRRAELASNEFERVQKLFLEKKIGSESGVEQAESALRQIQGVVLELEAQLEQGKPRQTALQAQLASAEVHKEQAALNLERCEVRSPWRGRLTRVEAEVGQFAAIGQSLAKMADDRYLEVPVALSAEQVMRGLSLAPRKDGSYPHWFKEFENVPAVLRWVEAGADCLWDGRVVRVEQFDAETRTLAVIVRPLSPVAGAVEGARCPLVAGMFCHVTVPGRLLENAVVIPRTSIQLGGDVFVVNAENRLEERTISISYTMDNRAVVSAGLNPGESIVAGRVPSAVSGMQVNPVTVGSALVQHGKAPATEGLPHD